MGTAILDLLSSAAAVVAVGLAAVGLLLTDLVRRELAYPGVMPRHHRLYALATTVVFVVLVIVRFVTRGA